ncbi:hypothetical protein [Streptomyces sp. TLI_146]|uniref:hypothetical protein n=1 Tax=Streptomyces sp. TLI_146 TaxID=1938858 RepID=UPI000CC49B3B|nr:hypothetical protein [Streptomyces sp. TLI_146]PKV82935.1 hypothetical protein BX283_0409 [Streptomyces sp. TLI_146]
MGTSASLKSELGTSVELFGVDSAGGVWHRWQTFSGSGWSDWYKFDGTLRP